MSRFPHINRRQFIRITSSVAGGVLLTAPLGAGASSAISSGRGAFVNAYLEITKDNRFLFSMDKVEMGQGVARALPLLMAEELNVHPDLIVPTSVTLGGSDANPLYRPGWGTGASTSVSENWLALRRLGAASRLAFEQAAARHWRADQQQCYSLDGVVFLAGADKSVTYADLLAVVTGINLDQNPPLKPVEAFRYIGKFTPRHQNNVDMVSGKHSYGFDRREPAHEVAMLSLRPPGVGGDPAFDQATLLSDQNITGVYVLKAGIAVVGSGFYPVSRVVGKLDALWSAPTSELDNSLIERTLLDGLAQQAALARKTGADTTVGDGVYEADYLVPYLSQCPLEPMNCTVDYSTDGCEVWVPTQSPQRALAVVVQVTGLPQHNIVIHSLPPGGAFGRRLSQDYVDHAVSIAVQHGRPIKFMSTRENDMRSGYYRTAAAARMRGRFNAHGKLVAISATLNLAGKGGMSQPRGWRGYLDAAVREFKERWHQEIARPYNGTAGIASPPYTVDSYELRCRYEALPVSTGLWRSVDHSYNCFFVESFIDELAHAAAIKPLDFRLKNLKPTHRMVKVLGALGEMLPSEKSADCGLGIACHEAFGSCMALAVELVPCSGEACRVSRVWCAIDPGIAIDPENIATQMEGGVLFGLSAAVGEEVILREGQVQSSNFHDYPLLRMNQSPAVNVAIVASSLPPGGVGEAGTPLVAPALANAYHDLTGRRIRKLPIQLGTSS